MNRKKELGADHVKTVDIASHLANSTFEEERLIEAEPHFRHAVDMYYNLYGSTEKDVKT